MPFFEEANDISETVLLASWLEIYSAHKAGDKAKRAQLIADHGAMFSFPKTARKIAKEILDNMDAGLPPTLDERIERIERKLLIKQ